MFGEEWDKKFAGGGGGGGGLVWQQKGELDNK